MHMFSKEKISSAATVSWERRCRSGPALVSPTAIERQRFLFSLAYFGDGRV